METGPRGFLPLSTKKITVSINNHSNTIADIIECFAVTTAVSATDTSGSR